MEDAWLASAFYRFEDHEIRCDGTFANAGEVSQRVPVADRPAAFTAHPIALDGWQSCAHRDEGPAVQPLNTAHPSALPDGGSAPFLGLHFKTLERLADTVVETPAGDFDCRRYQLNPSRPDWPPMEVCVFGSDRVTARLTWALLDLYCRLVELSRPF